MSAQSVMARCNLYSPAEDPNNFRIIIYKIRSLSKSPKNIQRNDLVNERTTCSLVNRGITERQTMTSDVLLVKSMQHLTGDLTDELMNRR